MRIGFLMGSFDPIHIGHVNMVRVVLESGLVDKVILVPSGHNPWKKEEPAPFGLRYQMAELSVMPFGSKCAVSNVESLFEPPFYSNKPLNYFREIYPDDERFIICGTDTVDKIPHWKNATEDILPYYRIIAIEREHNSGIGHQIWHVEDGKGKKYEYDKIYSITLPVSSTYVRQLIKEDKPLYPLLNEQVVEIINKNKLYR